MIDVSDKDRLLELLRLSGARFTEKHTYNMGKVVLTHDRDFGGLALLGAKFVGIIYLRPGHIQADFTIKTLQSIRDNAPDVVPPFILVAERTGDTVKIRVRQM